MDPREQEVLDLLTANGGTMLYPALYNAIAPENRLGLRKTLQRLKSKDLISQSNNYNPETRETLHSVAKVG